MSSPTIPDKSLIKCPRCSTFNSFCQKTKSCEWIVLYKSPLKAIEEEEKRIQTKEGKREIWDGLLIQSSCVVEREEKQPLAVLQPASIMESVFMI